MPIELVMVPLGEALIRELQQTEPRLIRVAILSASLKRILETQNFTHDEEGIVKMREADFLLQMNGWGPIFRKWYENGSNRVNQK
jgi:hypothetical protein